MKHIRLPNHPKKGEGQESLGSKVGKHLRSVPNVLLSAVLGIGSLLGYLILIPRMTPAVSDPVDPNDPFSASVTLINSGLIPLEALDVYVVLGEIQFIRSDGTPIAIEGEPGSATANCESTPPEAACIHHTSWSKRNLGYDDAIVIDLNQVFSLKKEHLQSARIAISVSYKLPIIGLKRSRVFPLYAIKQTNANWYWRRDTPAN